MRTVEEVALLLESAAPKHQVEVIDDYVRLEFIGALSVRYAYLHEYPLELLLTVYPGDTLAQARALYRDPVRCNRLLALRERGWEITPTFHFGFANRGFHKTHSAIGTDGYVAYWIRAIAETTAIGRDEWDGELKRLVEDGIFASEDLGRFATDFKNTHRSTATPRPGLRAVRSWQAETRHTPNFQGEVRQALKDVLAALHEPSL